MVAALLLGACATPGAAAGPAKTPIGRGRFRVAITEPASLDPVLASQPSERLIASQLFEGLVGYDATTAAVVPAVATSWDITDANTVFTFHLRPDARFSDGEKVTAACFVRGFTRALSPALAAAPGNLSGQLSGIAGAGDVTAGRSATLAGAVALDATTLRIRLSAPDAEFLLRLGDGAFAPVPPAATAPGQAAAWAADPVGDGPFELGAAPAGGWLGGGPITLIPNPFHTTLLPHAAEVVLKPMPSVPAASRAWMAGLVDWAPIPPTSTAAVEALGKQSFLEEPVAAVDSLTVEDPGAPSGADLLDLREAISLAIDRGGIVTDVFDGAATVATGFVPPLVPGSASAGGGACPACGFNPGRARQLLAASAVGAGGSVPLYFPYGLGEDALMQTVAQDLRANLGLDVQALPVPVSATGAPELPPSAGSAAIVLTGTEAAMTYPGPGSFLAVLPPGAASAAAVAAAQATGDASARAGAYAAAERLAMSDLPVVPLVWPEGLVLARLTRWSGLGLDPFGNPTLRTVAERG